MTETYGDVAYSCQLLQSMCFPSSSQLCAQDLARPGLGQLLHNDHPLGNFVGRQCLSRESANLLGRQLGSIGGYEGGHYHVAPLTVRRAEDGRLSYEPMVR